MCLLNSIKIIFITFFLHENNKILCLLRDDELLIKMIVFFFKNGRSRVPSVGQI